MTHRLIWLALGLVTGGARAEGLCEVFVDDETLSYVSETSRAILVDRRFEHCVEVDTGESVSEARSMVSFVELRAFDGRPIARYVKKPEDGNKLQVSFGTADGAELRDAAALPALLAEGAFVRPKPSAKSPTGCTASVLARVPFGETDAGVYTVVSVVKTKSGAEVLTKELGAASERPGKQTFKGRSFWLASARVYVVEAHMPQRKVLADSSSPSVAAGQVVTLTSDLLAPCFAAP